MRGRAPGSRPGDAAPPVLAGGGEAEITPPPGTPFGGFALERAEPARAVHDPLLATTTVVADGVGAIALISCDLQAIAPAVVARARARIEACWGIPATRTLIGATHVHSAPGGDGSERQIPGVDTYFTTPEAERRIVAGIVESTRRAMAALRPAVLLGARGMIAGIGRSRHLPGTPARAPAALVVAADPASGAPLAVIASHGCHASILGADNTMLSADYPGVLRAELRRAFGGAPVNFLNGPAGDISTRATRRDTTFAEVARLGTRLARQLARLRPALGPMCAAPVGGHIARAILAVDPALLAGLEEELGRPEPTQPARERRLRFHIARLRRLEGGTVPCEVQLIRCGQVAIVGIAGELFSEPAAEIAAAIPAALPILVSPANGTVGNLPPPHLHATVRPLVAPSAAGAIAASVRAACAALGPWDGPPAR